MPANDKPTIQELMAAVQKIEEASKRLQSTVTKKDLGHVVEDIRTASSRRVRLVVLTLLLAIICACVLSLFFTFTAVSQCFLENTTNLDAHPGYCNVIPNYSKVIKLNKVRVNQFTSVVVGNQQKLKQLQREIRELRVHDGLSP